MNKPVLATILASLLTPFIRKVGQANQADEYYNAIGLKNGMIQVDAELYIPDAWNGFGQEMVSKLNSIPYLLFKSEFMYERGDVFGLRFLIKATESSVTWSQEKIGYLLEHSVEDEVLDELNMALDFKVIQTSPSLPVTSSVFTSLRRF